MTAQIIPFPIGGESPEPPPAIDAITRVSVLQLAAVGFRFQSASSDAIVLVHDTYGELRLANGLRTEGS